MFNNRPEVPKSDETLAAGARDGCLKSFAELVARFQVPVQRYLARRVTTAEDAEDLTQDVFLRAYRNLDRFDPHWPFRTWLFSIAHRLSINHYRRRTHSHQSLQVLDDYASDPARLAADEDSRQLLWDLAAKVLTESQWSSLWLYYVEGLAVAEIGPVLSCSPSAVKALLHRARRKLGRAIADCAEFSDANYSLFPAETRHSAPENSIMHSRGES